MRIAYIGQRGVPATFGGIERHVEELGAGLAARGHEVVVWCRDNYGDGVTDGRYRGMQLRLLPTIATRRLEAAVPSVIAAFRSLRGFDVVHFHAIGPGVAAVIPRVLARAAVVQTIHGLDNERAKWQGWEQRLLGFGAWMSARVPDETVVVSQDLHEHYRTRYHRRTTVIRNGVHPAERVAPGDLLRSLGLVPGRYALFVGRLVPEKAPDLLVQAFRAIADPDARLVIVGGSSYTNDYVDRLHELGAADDRVIFVGYRYGEELGELFSNTGAFVLPSYLEGLPLTILEAAAHGVPVVASAIPPHREVLVESAPGHRLFEPGSAADLTAALAETLAGGAEVVAGAKSLRDDALLDWTWDRCIDAHEQLYERLAARRRR